MAIYHLSFKTAAKDKGRSAGAHARYIEREGKYALSRANEALEYTASGNMPGWAEGNELAFWDASDLYERANGRVYSELEVALPRELSSEERQRLVTDFVAGELRDQPYTVAIHNKRALDGGEQPHAHIMFSERQLDGIERSREQFFKRANDKNPEKGGTKKNRDWNRREKIDEVRLSWEKAVNRSLQLSGIEQQVDRRTLKEQGIDRVPEPKMGPERTQMLRDGKGTEISDQVIELRHYRTEEREIAKLKENLKQEQARVYQFGERSYEESHEQSFTIERVGPARKISEEEEKRYKRVLDLVFTKAELESGHTEYRWSRSGRVAFVDEGSRITFTNTNETAVKAAFQLAKAKGWTGVVVTGNEAFRRESWVQGQVLGVKVEGYAHTKTDELEVERRRAELEKKKAQYRAQDKEHLRQQRQPESERRTKHEKEDGTDSQSVPASHALRLYQKHIEKDAAALQGVERELYVLRQHPETFTEADAVKRVESEFSKGRTPKLEEETKRASKAKEAAEKRYNEFVKEKGIGIWLPGNLREERRLLRELKGETATLNGKLEERQAFEQELAKPETKQQFDERVKALLSEHKERQERKQVLQAKKDGLSRKLAPHRKTIEKLRALGDRAVALTDVPGKGEVDLGKLDTQLQRLQEEQEKKLSKGRER
jgi:hypothetical protein